MIAECEAAACAGFEVRAADLSLHAELVPLLADSPLLIAAVSWHDAWHDRSRARELVAGVPSLLEAMTDLAAHALVLSIPGSNARLATAGSRMAEREDVLSPSDLAYLADHVHRVGDLAVEAGVSLRFRPRLASFIESEEEIEQFLEATDPELVTWAVDFGHLALLEIDALPLLARHAPRVGHAYLRDLDAELADAVRFGERSLSRAVAEGLFVPPGKGVAPLREPLLRLREEPRCLWWVLDLATPTDDPRVALEATNAYLEKEVWS